MEFTRILYHRSGSTARITLNRPEKRNALDDVMIRELLVAFETAGTDEHTRTVCLAAHGSAFCAGADLEYLQRISTFDLRENRADSGALADLFRSIYTLKKPVIALVNGPALAGGCGLASVCDFVLASREKATFGYTEVRIGFIPAVVMTFLLKRVGEGRAREMILRGSTISADEALVAGLVNAVVPEDELERAGESLAAELAGFNSPAAMALCKEMLGRLGGLDLEETLQYAADMNAAARMTEDCKKGLQAFLRKEKLRW